MPPPPPPPIGIAGLSFGTSATIASVVIRRPATEGRVLQRGAHDLRRIDDAGLDHVDIFFGLGVEAPVLRLVLADLADDDRTFGARISSARRCSRT
jgi:hypothetical protein